MKSKARVDHHHPVSNEKRSPVTISAMPVSSFSFLFLASFLILPQLILISGYPSSGKTHRSLQLLSFLNMRISASTDALHSRLKAVHINDQSLGLSRDVYAEAKTEKDARAAEYSAVKRAIGRETIVIADGMNYIKGFRYQLYCEAKALQTPSCVVRFPSSHPTSHSLLALNGV